MKVKCTQCGKVFEVPGSQAQRALKCVCKNIFLAVPIIEELNESMEAGKSPKNHDLEVTIPRGFDPNFEASAGDVPEESEQSLDEFVSFLKQSSAKNQSQEKAAAPVSKRPAMRTIELANEPVKVIEPAEKVKAKPVDIPEPTRQEKANTVPIPKPSKRAPQKVKKQAYKNSHLIIAAAFSLLVLISAIALRPTPPEEPMDPYLTKLLTPKDEAHVAAPITAHKVLPPAVPAKKEVSIVNKAPQNIPTSPLLEKLKVAAFNGDFEDVVRIGSTNVEMGVEEKALFFEALFERAGDRTQRHDELNQKLESEKKLITDPSASPLIRTTAFAIIRNPSPEKNLPHAIEILKSLSLTRSWDPFVPAYLGLAYEEMDRLDLAHAAWDRALSLQPKYIWVLEMRDLFYRSEKKYSEALDVASKINAIPGQELNGLRRLAEISELKNDINSAVTYYRRAIKIKDSAQLRRILGEILIETNSEAAIREFQAGLSAKPSRQEKRDLYIQIGRAQCAQKNFSAASSAFKRALLEDPNSIKIVSEKAKCELGAKSYRAAAATLEKALTLNPNNFQLWYDYGRALSLQEKQRAAIAALKRSIELKETDQSHLLMAQLLVAAKKKTEALIHLKKAIELNPKNREARALLKNIN